MNKRTLDIASPLPEAPRVPAVNAADQGIPPVLDEVVRRVVEVADPDAIVLFGSAARDAMGPHSDIDLLVIKAGAHRRRLAQAIYRHLMGLGQAVDVVVVTPDDVQRYQHCPGMVVEPALREGKAIYGTWSPPAG
jgi:predicted nucleotidyltransferase